MPLANPARSARARSTLTRSAFVRSALPLLGCVATGLVLLSPSPASAAGAVPAPGQPLGVSPAAGNALAIPQLTTSGPCPAGTTHGYAVVYGGALPDDGQVLRDTTRSGVSSSGAFTVDASRTLRDVFVAAGTPTAPGSYVVELVCSNELGARLATFTGTLTFTTADDYTASAGPAVTPKTLAEGQPPAQDPAADPFAGPPAGEPGQAAAARPGAVPLGPDVQPVPPNGSALSAAQGSESQGDGETGATNDAAQAKARGTTGDSSGVGVGTLVLVAAGGAAAAGAVLFGVPALRRRRSAAAAPSGPDVSEPAHDHAVNRS